MSQMAKIMLTGFALLLLTSKLTTNPMAMPLVSPTKNATATEAVTLVDQPESETVTYTSYTADVLTTEIGQRIPFTESPLSERDFTEEPLPESVLLELEQDRLNEVHKATTVEEPVRGQLIPVDMEPIIPPKTKYVDKKWDLEYFSKPKHKHMMTTVKAEREKAMPAMPSFRRSTEYPEIDPQFYELNSKQRNIIHTPDSGSGDEAAENRWIGITARTPTEENIMPTMDPKTMFAWPDTTTIANDDSTEIKIDPHEIGMNKLHEKMLMNRGETAESVFHAIENIPMDWVATTHRPELSSGFTMAPQFPIETFTEQIILTEVVPLGKISTKTTDEATTSTTSTTTSETTSLPTTTITDEAMTMLSVDNTSSVTTGIQQPTTTTELVTTMPPQTTQQPTTMFNVPLTSLPPTTTSAPTSTIHSSTTILTDIEDIETTTNVAPHLFSVLHMSRTNYDTISATTLLPNVDASWQHLDDMESVEMRLRETKYNAELKEATTIASPTTKARTMEEPATTVSNSVSSTAKSSEPQFTTISSTTTTTNTEPQFTTSSSTTTITTTESPATFTTTFVTEPPTSTVSTTTTTATTTTETAATSTTTAGPQATSTISTPTTTTTEPSASSTPTPISTEQPAANTSTTTTESPATSITTTTTTTTEPQSLTVGSSSSSIVMTPSPMETTTIAAIIAAPEARALPAPRIERIFNSDGVEVLYGYSSVNLSHRS